MKPEKDLIVPKNDFRLGYRFQHFWDVHMALAFFCGEWGAGLIVVGLLADYLPGLIAGLVILGIGKPYFHLSHMGVPGRSWKAILRPDRSWVSRGLIAIMVLIGSAGLVALFEVAAAFGWTGMEDSFLVAGLARILKIAAGLSALVVMTYQGFSMSHSAAISLWNSPTVPLASLSYSLLAGAATCLALAGFGGVFGAEERILPTQTVMALTLATLAIVLGIVFTAKSRSEGGRVSAKLLTKTHLAQPFWVLVVGIGLVGPAFFYLMGPDLAVGLMVAGFAVLLGFLAFRILIFKAGVYEPIISFAPTD